MANDMINELAAYLGLLVHNAGGEVRMSYEFVEAGTPPGQVVKIHMDEDTKEVVFELVEKPNE